MDTKTLQHHADKLLEATVAGTNTSHGGENNLRKIRLMVGLDENNTYGMQELLAGATFEEAYEAVTALTGHPPDTEENPERGCIDPSRTAEALLEAGRRIREVAEGGGRLLFATGHPGALVLYYLELSRWVAALGGEPVRVETQQPYATAYNRRSPVDWVENVAMLGNQANLWHTHDPQPMREILSLAGPVDMVVADHGFAGAAIAAGIPTVAIMDTNDPAFAVVSRRGTPELTVIPMDDNRPPNAYVAALDLVKEA